MNAIQIYAMAFFAVGCYAAMPVLLKKLQVDIPDFALMATTMMFLCLYSIIASVCFEKDFSILKIDAKIWRGLAFFGFVNFVGFAAFLWVIVKLPIAQYQLIGLATPILGGAFAYWLLGEHFKIQYLYGLVFIGIGLFIALREGVK